MSHHTQLSHARPGASSQNANAAAAVGQRVADGRIVVHRSLAHSDRMPSARTQGACLLQSRSFPVKLAYARMHCMTVVGAEGEALCEEMSGRRLSPCMSGAPTRDQSGAGNGRTV